MADSRSIEAASPPRRSLGRSLVLVSGVSAVVFAGYLMANLSPFDEFFEAAVHSTRSNGMTALDPVFYGIAGMAAFVLLLGVLRCFGMVLKRFSKPDTLSKYPERSIEQFTSAATMALISERVARESYQLLRNYYPDRMCIDLKHDLRDDLELADEDILQLHAGLLSRTERREMRDLTAASIATVLDLLDYVESAPAQHLDGVAVRIRSTDVASAERTAAADTASGIFFRSQPSGPRRRATDYTGPRRRATDNKVKRAYSGPHRRASDRLETPPAGASEDRTHERSSESPAEQTAADLNKQDPHFVPPRSQRITT